MRYKMTFATDLTIAHLKGHVDEHVGGTLAEVRRQIRTRRAVLDLGGVGILNSVGVSIWLAHIKAFDDLELELTNCPHPFTSLVLLVPELAGKGRIHSFFVRYFCDHCADDEEQQGLVTSEETLALGTFPAKGCRKCGLAMGVEEADLDLLELFAPVKRAG